MTAYNGQVILNLRLERPHRSTGSSEAQVLFLPTPTSSWLLPFTCRWKETGPTQRNRRKGPTSTSCPHLLRRWVADQDSLVKGLSKKQDERNSFLPNMLPQQSRFTLISFPSPSKYNPVTLTKELYTSQRATSAPAFIQIVLFNSACG